MRAYLDINSLTKSTDLAYAAGYVDGDGCFHIGKRGNKFIVQFIITSTNREVLAWFQRTFQGSISSAKKKNINITHKDLYQFSLSKLLGIPFAESIFSYLVEKREEAQLFINFASAKTSDEKMNLIDKMKILKNHTNLVLASNKSEFEGLKNTIIPTKEDFAYLAGFIDAECCLGIQRYRAKNKPNYLYKSQLQCNNTKAPIFKWLLQRFG